MLAEALSVLYMNNARRLYISKLQTELWCGMDTKTTILFANQSDMMSPVPSAYGSPFVFCDPIFYSRPLHFHALLQPSHHLHPPT